MCLHTQFVNFKRKYSYISNRFSNKQKNNNERKKNNKRILSKRDRAKYVCTVWHIENIHHLCGIVHRCEYQNHFIIRFYIDINFYFLCQLILSYGHVSPRLAGNRWTNWIVFILFRKWPHVEIYIKNKIKIPHTNTHTHTHNRINKIIKKSSRQNSPIFFFYPHSFSFCIFFSSFSFFFQTLNQNKKYI